MRPETDGAAKEHRMRDNNGGSSLSRSLISALSDAASSTGVYVCRKTAEFQITEVTTGNVGLSNQALEPEKASEQQRG